MLNRLRGTEHFVISGITVMNSETGGWKTTDKSTRIVLRRYSDDEIARYVATGDCMDKAGGYAVQDEKFKPASIVQGCYLNAVGFPLCKVTELLAAFGVRTKVRPEWKFPSRFDGCSALKGRGANGR
jgi:predicted house-cleaning NTP pyrophosphatase (Maf/HAM1 superfamily)